PDASAGSLLLAGVTWFSGESSPGVPAGWAIVEDSVAHNGSGSNPVGIALLKKLKGTGSSAPHSVSGVSGQLVICRAWAWTDAPGTTIRVMAVAAGQTSSHPYLIGLPGIGVAADGSGEGVIASSWTFPIDLPAGFTEWLQHFFEML